MDALIGQEMKTHPHFDSVLFDLRHKPKRWLVTGCAGFIGSHLIEHLLRLQQTVVGIDNFATGSARQTSKMYAVV